MEGVCGGIRFIGCIGRTESPSSYDRLPGQCALTLSVSETDDRQLQICADPCSTVEACLARNSSADNQLYMKSGSLRVTNNVLLGQNV